MRERRTVRGPGGKKAPKRGSSMVGPRSFRFGIQNSAPDLNGVLKDARAAEAAGFDIFQLGDHLGTGVAPLGALAVVASLTDRIGLVELGWGRWSSTTTRATPSSWRMSRHAGPCLRRSDGGRHRRRSDTSIDTARDDVWISADAGRWLHRLRPLPRVPGHQAEHGRPRHSAGSWPSGDLRQHPGPGAIGMASRT